MRDILGYLNSFDLKAKIDYIGTGFNEVIDEVPAGLINGSNATFTTAYNFDPATLEVFLNGLKQKVTDDYSTSGTTTIIFTFSPLTGERVTVDYIKL